MENIFTLISDYGKYLPFVFLLLGVYSAVKCMKYAVSLAKIKSGKANDDPFDGSRFGDDPEKLEKNIKTWGFVVFLSFSLMGSSIMASGIAKAMTGGGVSVKSSDINKPVDQYKTTPLMDAIRRGKSIKSLEKMLDMGADIHAKDNVGMTPLMYAAAWGTPEIIQFLLDKGARIDDRDNSGDTAIFKAVKWVKPQNVYFFADKGTGLNSTGYANYTPLVAALNDWNIMQNSKANADTSRLRTKNRASYKRNLERKENGLREIIQYLAAKNADPTIRDSRGRDAIAHSKGTEFEELINVLALKYTVKGIQEKAIEEQAGAVLTYTGSSD